MKGKITDKYVIPENAEVKEVNTKRWINGVTTFEYQDKRSAAYACAIGSVCNCGKSFEGKQYIYCPDCRDKRRDEKYNSLELVEWDGKTPLSNFDGDEYFYDEDAIQNYIDYEGVEVELQLVLCKQVFPSEFSLDDYTEGHLPEDFGLDDLETKEQKYTANEVEAIVNDYLKTLAPVWYPSNKRVTIK